jgi:4-hydroxythreonine-4-phosphate dehydrogenase
MSQVETMTEKMMRIAITMGDPAGIGPEILVKALADEDIRSRHRLLLIGEKRAMRRAVDVCGLDPDIRMLQDEHDWLIEDPGPAFLDLGADVEHEIRLGVIDKNAGRLAARFIEKAAGLAMEGKVDAMVTCPIHKEALALAGVPFPGHTELLAHLTGARKVVMMLAGERLKVTLVTIHCPLSDVPGLLTRERILETILITNRGLRRDWGLANPRLAVAGFNPHAGEGGLFGKEETDIIAPAVEAARSEGVNAVGPLPPDTVFFQAAAGRFDAVVCMYHDQGLIPLKLLHFQDGVNVTLGLPIVRVSVDHGTAFDIAGRGTADPTSLINAIKTAGTMARNRASFPVKEEK